MNLETKEQKDLKISNCDGIWSFENKILIDIEENEKYTYNLFKFKEGELQLLDEKTNSEFFGGSANLGVLHSENLLLNFSTGKLVFSKNKVKRDKWFYNYLAGPTHYPEFADEICP